MPTLASEPGPSEVRQAPEGRRGVGGDDRHPRPIDPVSLQWDAEEGGVNSNLVHDSGGHSRFEEPAVEASELGLGIGPLPAMWCARSPV